MLQNPRGLHCYSSNGTCHKTLHLSYPQHLQHRKICWTVWPKQWDCLYCDMDISHSKLAAVSVSQHTEQCLQIWNGLPPEPKQAYQALCVLLLWLQIQDVAVFFYFGVEYLVMLLTIIPLNTSLKVQIPESSEDFCLQSSGTLHLTKAFSTLLCLHAQSCPTLQPPELWPTRLLCPWVAMPSSRGSSQSRD